MGNREGPRVTGMLSERVSGDAVPIDGRSAAFPWGGGVRASVSDSICRFDTMRWDTGPWPCIDPRLVIPKSERSHSPIARSTSSMLCGRRAGSFSRQRRTKDSTTSGTVAPGTRSAIGCTA